MIEAILLSFLGRLAAMLMVATLNAHNVHHDFSFVIIIISHYNYSIVDLTQRRT